VTNLLDQLIEARTTREDHAEAMATLLAGDTAADLDGLLTDALGRTERLGQITDDQRTDADVDALEALVDVITALRTQQGLAAAARAERNERMRSALDRARGPQTAATEGAGDGAHAKKSSGEGAEGDGESGEGEGAEGDGEDDDDGKHSATSGTPMAAAVVTQRAPLGALGSDKPKKASRFLTRSSRPAGGSYVIEAASEMPGIAPGSDLGDLKRLSNVIHKRMMGLERAGSGHADIATIRRIVPEGYYANGDATDEIVTLDQLRSMRADRHDSLVASGGWCAPSEILYDLCDVATMDGILDHPSVVVKRGGLRWPQTPDFSTVYGNVGFNQTEAQAAAGTSKPAYDIPCPGFSEQRLNAIGLALRAGILTAQAYPELVEWYVQQALIAHAHQVNAFKLSAMQTLATSVPFTAGTGSPVLTSYGPGAFASIMGVLEMQVTDLKYKYRWDMDEPLECVAPAWVEPLIRDDLSKRTGVSLENVTDQMIADYFAKRSMNLQLVYDWQDALTNSGTGFGANTPITAYPKTVGFLLYHADSYVMGQADVIDLSAIYDSQNIQTNTFTRMFSEEGVLVGKRCFEPRFVQIDVCPNGMTGGFADPTRGWQLACPAA